MLLSSVDITVYCWADPFFAQGCSLSKKKKMMMMMTMADPSENQWQGRR